jgi:aerobic carbon-monoxide dehydrogenase large subunit
LLARQARDRDVRSGQLTMSSMGRGISRLEDARFLSGEAKFVDDIKLPGMLHGVFVRSPYAHGRIVSLALGDARVEPGVRAILTAVDASGLGAFPLVVRGADVAEQKTHPVFAEDAVHYVGQPVALVVADTAEGAADVAERVVVDIEELPPTIDPQLSSEVLLRARFGEDVDSAFYAAAYVVQARVEAPRLIAAPLEPRAVVASVAGDVLTLWLSAQDQHRQLAGLGAVLGRTPAQLHIIVPDVGGAFGSKGVPQAETVAVALAALQLGRPVKWAETRTESSLAVYQGRGQQIEAELALGADGRMLALRARVVADLGAFLYSTTPVAPITCAQLLSGTYAIPAALVEVVGVRTNKVPTGPYRGAGRPEAALALERLVDLSAAEVGIDRVELRRRNLIRSFPHENGLGLTYDSGDYEGVLDAALELADYPRLTSEAERTRDGEHLAGVGLALYVERVGPGWEGASVTIERDRRVIVRTGASSHGQGHETTFAQITADALGVDVDGIEVRSGDSWEIPTGMGTFASRSTTVAGSAILLAAREVRERLDAGEMLPLEADARFELPGPVFSSGAYVAAVTIERATGEVRITKLVAVDDCGFVVNPLLAEGQVVGGAVQGVGEALYEQVGYDEDGQPLAVNLHSYHLPTALSVPPIATAFQETPSPWNPLGAKGVGEGGSIGTPAAIANAVADALTHIGIQHMDLPFTPSRVWSTIDRAPR